MGTTMLCEADLKIVSTGTIFSKKEMNHFFHSANFNFNHAPNIVTMPDGKLFVSSIHLLKTMEFHGKLLKYFKIHRMFRILTPHLLNRGIEYFLFILLLNGLNLNQKRKRKVSLGIILNILKIAEKLGMNLRNFLKIFTYFLHYQHITNNNYIFLSF